MNRDSKTHKDDRLENFEKYEKNDRFIVYLILGFFTVISEFAGIYMFVRSLINGEDIALYLFGLLFTQLPLGFLLLVIHINKQKDSRLLKALDIESQEELERFLNECTRLEYYLYMSPSQVIDMKEKMVYNFDEIHSVHQEQRSASSDDAEHSENYLVSFISNSHHKLIYLSFTNVNSRDIAFRKISAAVKEYQKVLKSQQ